jgi:hypothetical protein
LKELKFVLNLRIVRGPLEPQENEQILKEYNRLTKAIIPMNEFLHWVQKGPLGPAWHAMLETNAGRIVGHTSLIPLRTSYGNGELLPAKSEYSFAHEDFRSTPVRGFENVKRAKFLILVDQLFQHGKKLGLDPIFVSTREANHALSRRVGCKKADFPLWECLLIRNPVAAARHTPNVESKKRMALLVAGISQCALWPLLSLTLAAKNGILGDSIDSEVREPDTSRLSFFDDRDHLRWRYLEGQYERLRFENAPNDYLIAKRGSPEKYLRVCQWHLGSKSSVNSVMPALVQLASRQRAMGVRWAVYDNDSMSQHLVSRMRRLGFLCARRNRVLMINTNKPNFYEPAAWRVNDSLVSFDP